MIKQIKFVSIPVADQNRALDFYTDKLGFTIITDQPFDEKQRWIELRVPKAETRVVLFTPDGDEKRIGSFMNMSYECDDIDKTYKELSARGVEFEGPPQNSQGHLRDVQRQRRQPVRGLVNQRRRTSCDN
jgi:catechol 2,3-dioxygenase-like lactoylglutathione lyase family enzyme